MISTSLRIYTQIELELSHNQTGTQTAGFDSHLSLNRSFSAEFFTMCCLPLPPLPLLLSRGCWKCGSRKCRSGKYRSQKNKDKSNEVTWGLLNIILGWCSIRFTPAFSTPAIYSCFFHSCIFHPCNFARIAFSTPAFSVAPLSLPFCMSVNLMMVSDSAEQPCRRASMASRSH